MEPGLFVTFFEPGEPFDRELPPVGPLVHLVARPRQLVAERSAVHQAPDVNVAIDRWLEAELELQRALGEEPGGTRRSEMRVTARDGVFVRLAVFGDERERDPVPELGPFAVVVVGRRSVDADGQVLATRSASELAPWELGSAAGRDLAGTHKPDVAFRAQGGAYHPAIVPMAPRAVVAEPVARQTSPLRPAPVVPQQPDIRPETGVRAEIVITPAPAPAAPPPPAPSLADPPPAPAAPPPVPSAPVEAPPALTPADLALVQRVDRQREEEHLRARIQEAERRRLGVDAAEDPAATWAMRYREQTAATESSGVTAAEEGGGLELGDLLWRLRFALLGLLVIAVGAYGFLSIRSGGGISLSGGGQSFDQVGIAQKVSSARWDYVVNGVQRVQTAGASRPNGIYYVVRIGVTNRGTEGAQLSPAEFTLIDASGTGYRAESTSSNAYYGPNNTMSQFIWPQSFAVGKTASVSVIFDVSPALGRGNMLTVDDLPRTRFALD